jgi:hypothetical protein
MQGETIAEALATLDIRLPLPPKPGTHKVRCPQCIPAGTNSNAKAKVRTDLVVAVRTNEALFYCRRCGFSRRIAVGRQPTPSSAPTEATP